MNKCIGIRHEDKYAMERRVAITPKHAEKLIKKHKLCICVENSTRRIFNDEEYVKAGANITDNLGKCPVIFGVKEMPAEFFENEKTYMFFSHVIKGQSYNMPMLREMIAKKCSLIDYEKVEDELGRRLIFFGRFAGLAGMINSLWSLGLRLKYYGFDTPFLRINQAVTYSSLEEIKQIISEVGQEIIEKGLPKEITPLTIGFTGYGNVSLGAQEIANLLPIKEVTPKELLKLKGNDNLANNVLYKVIFREKDLSKPIENGVEFDLQDYYTQPEKFEDQFTQYIPHLTVLMNCMYWDDRYPRIVTKDYLKDLYKNGRPKLTVIGDVTCDPDGSIECTHKGTEVEDPIFVYNPFTQEHEMGYEGKGLLIMPVDILPSELPREASESFGDALFNYVAAIASADYDVDFDKIDLPNPIKNAMILHKGEFTPNYKYIAEYL